MTAKGKLTQSGSAKFMLEDFKVEVAPMLERRPDPLTIDRGKRRIHGTLKLKA